MEHRTYYYARVSTKDQNLTANLPHFALWVLLNGRLSPTRNPASDLERKGYQALKSTIPRSGDTLVIDPQIPRPSEPQ